MARAQQEHVGQESNERHGDLGTRLLISTRSYKHTRSALGFRHTRNFNSNLRSFRYTLTQTSFRYTLHLVRFDPSTPNSSVVNHFYFPVIEPKTGVKRGLGFRGAGSENFMPSFFPIGCQCSAERERERGGGTGREEGTK